MVDEITISVEFLVKFLFGGSVLTGVGLYLKHRYDSRRFARESKGEHFEQMGKVVTGALEVADAITESRKTTADEFMRIIAYERERRDIERAEHDEEKERMRARYRDRLEVMESKVRSLLIENERLSGTLHEVDEALRPGLDASTWSDSDT